MSPKKKKKLSSILWAVAYFVVGLCLLCSATLVFHNNYYSFIYVDGYSMQPTLNKNGHTEFGIVDSHKAMMNNIKRFDIVTTYYPITYTSSKGITSDYCTVDEQGIEHLTAYDETDPNIVVSQNADYKIKRVIAMPGEQFKMEDDGVSIRNKNSFGAYIDSWTKYEYTFKHNVGDKTNSEPITLGDDEYWVIGDNWNNSIDCKSLNKPVKRGNLQGVLIAIEGTCSVRNLNGKVDIYNKKYYSTFKVFKR